MRTTLYIGGWRLDQFGDEAATVVSSVLDITDITKNTGDYTKTFTVPASKRNNLLFKHWYDADIDNGFDARLKVDGRIELDGFPFKYGQWRLSKVAIKKNKPSSYTVNFFGKLPSLKDIVKKDLLSDLDLSAYDHSYDSDNVKTGLINGLFSQDIIYNLFAKKQYFYDSDPNNNIQTDTLANIAGAAGVDTGVIWDDLRPSLKLIRIIEAIEERYNGKQKTTLNVVSPSISGFGGTCFLTLNGVEHYIDISTTTTEGNASELQVYIDALPDYTATISQATVTIEAVETESQINTTWQEFTATDMDVEVTTILKGSNGLRFTRDFFGTSEFNNLYMWLNPSADKLPGGGINTVNWFSSINGYWMNLQTNIGAYEVINISGSPASLRYFEIGCTITPAASFEYVEYEIISYKNGEEFSVTSHSGTDSQTISLQPEGETSGTTYLVEWKVRSEQGFEFTAQLYEEELSTFAPVRNDTCFSSGNEIESIFTVYEELPKLKIIDFLKGLFNMFKLVIVPQDTTGDYFIDTINSYYEAGSLHEVTKYVDFESYDVNRGEILNEIELKFKDPTTILNIQFEKNNKRGYGDILKTLTDDAGELLDGESLTFELPFEQFVYERLPDINVGTKTDIQYAAIIDEELEAASPSAHIFYGLRPSISTSPIGFQEDDNTRSVISGAIWTAFHHYGITQPNYASIFNAEFSTWDGISINNNLYSRHYSDYIESIFNIKKRTFNFEAMLPVHIVTRLQLNDVLKIKGNFYRIDKYTYNTLTGKTGLNLVNSFDNKVGVSSSKEQNIFVDYRSQTETIAFGDSAQFAPTKIDQGFGTSWVTLGLSGSNLDITFDEHAVDDGENRAMFLEYTTFTGDLSYIFLNQSGKPLTVDTTNTTADNNIITSDNG